MRFGKWFFVILYIFLLLGLSSIPSKQLHKLPDIFGADKAAHMVLYTGLGYLLGGATAPFTAITLGIVVGAVDENYQRLTPGREVSSYDWLADVIGILLGISIVRVLQRKKP